LGEIVVDTSVALKWIFTREANARKALDLLVDHLAGRCHIAVPSCFNHEAPHALRHSAYRLSLGEVRAAVRFLRQLGLRTHPTSPSLVFCALELSYAYGIPVFDAYFVATAIRRNCRFVTADRKAYNRMSRLSFVQLL